ncbi:MAG: VCBS repeat-containing protein [Bacteroidetes bacterium]|nr:VCBS repeat-containing protein [Bacteroidota bacterium]
MKYGIYCLLTSLLLFSACDSQQQSVKVESKAGQLFTALPAEYTGIEFSNQLDFDADFNIYKYRNFYNGGGVAIGDINNDGLPDIYFTANFLPNRLYLNKGDMVFEDITENSGTGGDKAWSTGVALADVNGDGFLDIYVCNSGDIEGDNKQNELFINQGDNTFLEQAEAFGLADRGYSTHAAFFDYDKDGDLDCYLLNNSYQAIGSFNLRKSARPQRDPVGGDKLFRNDGGTFTDVSEEAGIYGSVIGFGLGVTVGDLNRDGWPDIYVSNDFFERDYIYMNQGDGTFTEELEKQIRSISAASMGADLGDIDNDGFPDLFVTEMLPEGDDRLKTKTTFENWDRHQYGFNNGYHYQFTRNMLQLNNQNKTFSDIGRLAGVHATDWSWGALILDLNNDGLRDIYVANGIYQDLTDQDYIQFISNEETIKMITSGKEVDYKALVDAIPSEQIPNYAFVNKGDLQFENMAEAWGLATPSHSNGSAYGDLDKDGDLDLVVNNVNMPCFVYRNETNDQLPDLHYLRVRLQGEGLNPFGVGATVSIQAGDLQLYQEQFPTRGFQSSMDYVMHFGLGEHQTIDQLQVIWPDGSVSTQTDVATSQELTISQAEATGNQPQYPSVMQDPLFESMPRSAGSYRHRENSFIDFDRDRLIYHMMSTEGPAFASGDLNGDGLEDFFAGGAKGQAASVHLQTSNGGFQTVPGAVFEKDIDSEDVDAVLLDVEGDGDLDIYVASGGNEFSSASLDLIDRLYLNDGKGNFTKSPQRLPANKPESTACVSAADYDGDGDTDLFVGIRLKPFYYGVPSNGYLLENDGNGKFSNVTKEKAAALENAGMFTDAIWLDYDGDSDLDLITCGDWMQIRVFENDNNTFSEATESAGLSDSYGWWNCLTAADYDGDGDIDLVAGNHGLNSRFKADSEHPVQMYVNDFDRNGTAEQIITRYDEDQSLPFVLRHDLVAQMPHLKKKYLKYENYQGQTIEDIFSPEEMEGTIILKVTELASCVFLNQGDGTFQKQVLPMEAQFAPVYALLTGDYNADGNLDLLSAGNLYEAKPEVGKYDADYGLVLLGSDGGFSALRSAESGFRTSGAVRDLQRMKINGEERIVVVQNNMPLQLFKPLKVSKDKPLQ